MPGKTFKELGFKVGDRIICTHSIVLSPYKSGDVYKVCATPSNSVGIVIKGDFYCGTDGDWELYGDRPLIEETTVTTTTYKYGVFEADTKEKVIRTALIHRITVPTTEPMITNVINHRDEIIALLKELDK